MSWVGILDGAIIGPFWFLDNFGQPVNVNQENYLEMLREKVWPCLEEKNTTRHIWFQQDGAPSHTSNIVMDWLNLKFPGRVISRKSNVPWPPQSPDLNPLDYWLWGYCLSLVRKQNPQTIALMVQSVNDVCSVLEREQILKATGGIYKRMENAEKLGECSSNTFSHKTSKMGQTIYYIFNFIFHIFVVWLLKINCHFAGNTLYMHVMSYNRNFHYGHFSRNFSKAFWARGHIKIQQIAFPPKLNHFYPFF